MLKPKKIITRKEIQRDPLLESVDKAQAHLEDNRKNYLKAGVLLIVVLLGYNILSNRQGVTNSKASTELGEALSALDRKDKTTAEFQLETIYNDYKGTSSSVDAGYFLGKMHYDNNNYDKAISHLEDYINDTSNKFMYAPAILIIADIAKSSSENEQALMIINKGLKNCHLRKDINMLTLHKADILIEIGNRKEAKALVEKVLDNKDVSSWTKQMAQNIMGKLMS